MSDYDKLIGRGDAEALIPEEVSQEILQMAPTTSSVMKLARRLPDMSRNVKRMPVLNSILEAYFVGEQGRTPQTFDGIKKTQEMLWANKYIYAEEMAVIVPIPENVLDDSEYDVWNEVKPHVAAAFGRKFDAATLYLESGVTAPVLWPDGILLGMPAAHQVVLNNNSTDIYDNILGADGVIAKVEESGFFVDGHLGAISLRAKLRGLRDDNGQPIFKSIEGAQGRSRYELDGSPIEFPRDGVINPADFLLISGDWQQLVYSVRKDVTFKILTEGVITDNATPRAIVYNLGQDDMVALRCTFRIGWQLPNPKNPVQPTDASRYPFAALVPDQYSV